jgi:predicted ATPase/DNA-binding winged helix-turn-helix (wHTH) protein
MEADARELRDPIEFGPFTLIASERRLEKHGIPVKIGSRALDILAVLMQHAGKIVGKREILDRVWPGLVVEENTLRVHIKDLRRTLDDGLGDNRYIINVPGRGYSFLFPEKKVSSGTKLRLPSRIETSLPPRPRCIVGRDGAIAAVANLLLDKHFVTLHGPGGIGKTTIATAVAHQLDAHYEHAILFVDLATLTDGEFLPTVLNAMLGLLSSSEDPSTTLIHFLRNRRLLIVLDSCEHVVEAVAGLAERVNQWAPGVSLLATSREPLRANGEYIYRVDPLALPPDDREPSTAEILASPAVRLFMQHAQASGPPFALDAPNARLACQICRKLDGIALALELAAMRVGMHGLHETAQLLDSHLRLAWKGRRTASRRHQTLNAMLDWSHDLISDAERKVLRRLAIFAGSFSLDDSQAVAADEHITGLQVVDVLDQLVAKSLVASHAGELPVRYRLLDTTRAYAYEKLVDAGEEAATARRHAAHCTAFLLRTAAGHAGSVAVAHRRARDLHLGNVRAALKWCFSPDGDRGLGVALAAAASALFIELSLINECRRWAEQALDCLDERARGGPLELDLQAALGHALMFATGNNEHVRTALEHGLHIARTVRDPFAEFKLLSRLHMFYRRTGALERLLPINHRLAKIAAQLQDPVALAAAHVWFGASHHLLGHQREALAHLEEPVHQTAAIQQVAPSHFAFHHPGQLVAARALWLLGHVDQAVAMARQVAGRLIPAADAVTTGIALIWATSVHVWTRDWDTVEENADRLIRHAQQHGLAPYLHVGIGLRGDTMLARGDVDGSIDLLQQALKGLRLHHYELYTPELACTLALALTARGQPDHALPLIDDTLARVQRHGGAYGLPELLRVRGEVMAATGDHHYAAVMFEQSIALAASQAALGWQLRALTSLAKMRTRQGDGDAALRSLAAAYRLFKEGLDTPDVKAAAALIGGAP